MFIDLRKAFDTVDVDVLLAKLPSLGSTWIKLQWFQNYLTGRSKSVIINGYLCNPLPVTVGVPQGSTSSYGDMFNLHAC